MRRASIAAAVGLLVGAGWFGAASAQQTTPSYTGEKSGTRQSGQPAGQGGQTQQQPMSPGQTQPPGSTQQQDPQVLGSAFTARVTGEVQQVNRQTGQLTLSTPEGPMRVRFPTAALQNVNQGDRVTVMVGLVATEPAPAAMPRQPGTQPGTQPGQMPGTQPGTSPPGSQPGTGTPPGTTR